MGRLFTLWNKLTERQKFVAGFAAAWSVTWTLDRIADAIWGALPPLSPLAAAMSIAREYVLNGYVGMFLAGAVLIGFWANIASFVRRLRPHLAAYAILPLAFGVATALAFAIEWVQVRDDPELFEPVPAAKFNADHSARVFYANEPWILQRIARVHTTISVGRGLSAELGKWIAITGKVQDASPLANGNIAVSLSGHENTASLTFEHQWLQRLQTFDREQRIFAVCKIHSIAPTSVDLEDCELTQRAP